MTRRVIRSVSAICSMLALAAGSAFAFPAYAQFTSKNTGVTEAGAAAGYATNLSCSKDPGGCIPMYIGTVINALLGVFGALFFGLIIWGGIEYMTAGGEKGKTEKARQRIVNAIIGMVIVASSYAIVRFVLDTITTVTAGGGTT